MVVHVLYCKMAASSLGEAKKLHSEIAPNLHYTNIVVRLRHIANKFV